MASILGSRRSPKKSIIRKANIEHGLAKQMFCIMFAMTQDKHLWENKPNDISRNNFNKAIMPYIIYSTPYTSKSVSFHFASVLQC